MCIIIHIIAIEEQFIYCTSYHSTFVLYFTKKKKKSYSFPIHIFKYHIFFMFQTHNPSAAFYIIQFWLSQFYYSLGNVSNSKKIYSISLI